MITKAKITEIKSLADKRERDARGTFVAEGIKLVGELIGSKLRVTEVFALEQACDSLPHFHNISVVTPKEMERISHLKTPSSVVALVEIPRWELDMRHLERSLSLALDDIRDPGNLGTIIRLCDWFGIGDILCSPSSADCFNPKVVQATMGAISRVRVHYVDLPEILERMAPNTPIYGTFLEGGNIYKTQLRENGIILMGNEGRGISPETARYVTDKLCIPSYPAAGKTSESLNVAVAAGIICSEFRRRQPTN